MVTDTIAIEQYRHRVEEEARVRIALAEAAFKGVSQVEAPSLVHPAGVMAATVMLHELTKLAPEPDVRLGEQVIRDTIQELVKSNETNPTQQNADSAGTMVAASLRYLYSQGYLVKTRRERPSGSQRQRRPGQVAPTPAGRYWLQHYTNSASSR